VASELLLREDQLAVGDHVELAVLALVDRRFVTASVQFGRETRGPFVVAASDRAVVDLDLHGTDSTARTPAVARLGAGQAYG